LLQNSKPVHWNGVYPVNLDPTHIVPWSSDWLWSLPLSVAAVVIHVVGLYFIWRRLDHALIQASQCRTRIIALTYLERHWQLVGALEALNGLLLFGLSTAFLFAIIQEAWARIGRQPLRRTGLTT
jgi:hypothetical protein